MSSAHCTPAQGFWPLINQGENGKRKSSKRSVFTRWKWFGKRHELRKEKDSLPDSRLAPREAAYSAPAHEPRHEQCSVAKKLSQPMLRAISSVCNSQLLHSLSDDNLRRNGGLAGSYGQGLIPVPRVLHLPLQPPPPHAPPARQARGRPDGAAASEAQLCGPPREMSRFLMLPQEIRDDIYAYVFYSTRLTMGRRVTCTSEGPRASLDSTYHSSESASSSPSTSPEPRDRPRSRHRRYARTITQIKPAKNAMALFRVCRQITSELRSDDAWLSQVLFNFEDAATMLDVLGGALTPVQRSLVREVRVREGGLLVHQRMPSGPVRQTSPSSSSGPTPPPAPPHQQPPQPHQFGQRFLMLGGLMRLLPGLRLDRLTVLPALPCRVHQSTHCHTIPSVDMYRMSVNSHPPPPVNRAAPHEILTELLRTGSGWRELCYVHHDTNMLAADRARPSSLEAMMVNMGFWDADAEAYNEVFAEAERAERAEQEEQEEQERIQEEAAVAATVAQLEFESGSGIDALRRHGLGSLFTSYAARKEYRLPRWRHILTERDGLLSASKTNNEAKPGSASGWKRSIDAVIDEGFCEGGPPHSTVSVYGVRDGQALWAMETLEDVHNSRIGHDDFMVVVRRAGDRDEKNSTAKRKTKGEAAHYVEAGAPYPFKEGDPRALGYGSRWETLRPVLFPWDHLTVTRCRRDRYQHRDEYTVRSQRRRHQECR